MFFGAVEPTSHPVLPLKVITFLTSPPVFPVLLCHSLLVFFQIHFLSSFPHLVWLPAPPSGAAPVARCCPSPRVFSLRRPLLLFQIFFAVVWELRQVSHSCVFWPSAPFLTDHLCPDLLLIKYPELLLCLSLQSVLCLSLAPAQLIHDRT